MQGSRCGSKGAEASRAVCRGVPSTGQQPICTAQLHSGVCRRRIREKPAQRDGQSGATVAVWEKMPGGRARVGGAAGSRGCLARSRRAVRTPGSCRGKGAIHTVGRRFLQGLSAGQGAPLPELRAEVFSRRYQRPQTGLPEVSMGDNMGHGGVRCAGAADGWKLDGVAGGGSSREPPEKVSRV